MSIGGVLLPYGSGIWIFGNNGEGYAHVGTPSLLCIRRSNMDDAFVAEPTGNWQLLPSGRIFVVPMHPIRWVESGFT
jgi:hypothetical protein